MKNELAEADLKLSRYENKVLEAYLARDSYAVIAQHLGKSVKSVDNALQRAKRKLERKLGTLE